MAASVSPTANPTDEPRFAPRLPDSTRVATPIGVDNVRKVRFSASTCGRSGVPVGAVERVSGILDGRSYAGSGRFGVSGDRFGTLTDRVGDRSRDGRRRHRAGDRREQKQHREGYREGSHTTLICVAI